MCSNSISNLFSTVKILFAFVLFAVGVNFTGQAQVIDSAYQVNSSSISSVEAITTDKEGNVFVAGYFTDSVWINNRHVLKGGSTTSVMYFAGYQPNGDLLFKKIIQTGLKSPIQLETDDSGFVFISSLFSQNKMYLDGENQQHLITSGYGDQGFIMKVNKNGDHRWHAYTEGTKTKTTVSATEFVLTEYGDVIWIASAMGAISVHTDLKYNYTGFNSIGNEQVNRTGSAIMRFHPNSTKRYNGTVIGNTNATVRATTIAESGGNLYFGGQLSGTVDFDNSAASKELTLSGRAFYCSIDTLMNFRWVMPSTLHRFSKIRVNTFGKIKCFGTYGGVGSTKFEFGSISQDGVIDWEYSESFSSASFEVSDCETDHGGNVFVTGTFAGSGDFDPTSLSRSAGTSQNASFVVKYDSSGASKWLVTGTGNGSFTNRGTAIHLAKNNQLFWGGVYSRTFSFSGNTAQNLPYTTKILGYIAHFTECRSFQPLLSASDSSLCVGETTTLTVSGANSITWADTSLTGDIRTIKPTKSGMYQAIVSNDSGCFETLQLPIVVNKLPSPVITLVGDSVSVNGSWTTINWYLDDVVVNNQSGQRFKPQTKGEVYCDVVDENGCAGESNRLNYNLSVFDWKSEAGIHAYYHDHNLYINSNSVVSALQEVRIYNSAGVQCGLYKVTNQSENTIHLPLHSGVYFAIVVDEAGQYLQTRFVVTE